MKQKLVRLFLRWICLFLGHYGRINIFAGVGKCTRCHGFYTVEHGETPESVVWGKLPLYDNGELEQYVNEKL